MTQILAKVDISSLDGLLESEPDGGIPWFAIIVTVLLFSGCLYSIFILARPIWTDSHPLQRVYEELVKDLDRQKGALWQMRSDHLALLDKADGVSDQIQEVYDEIMGRAWVGREPLSDDEITQIATKLMYSELEKPADYGAFFDQFNQAYGYKAADIKSIKADPDTSKAMGAKDIEIPDDAWKVRSVHNYSDGSRIIHFLDGRKIKVFPDGTTTQIKLPTHDGKVKEHGKAG